MKILFPQMFGQICCAYNQNIRRIGQKLRESIRFAEQLTQTMDNRWWTADGSVSDKLHSLCQQRSNNNMLCFFKSYNSCQIMRVGPRFERGGCLIGSGWIMHWRMTYIICVFIFVFILNTFIFQQARSVLPDQLFKSPSALKIRCCCLEFLSEA